MSDERGKAEEIISRKQGTDSSQRWGLTGPDDDHFPGAHWNSNSRRSGGCSSKHAGVCSSSNDVSKSSSMSTTRRGDGKGPSTDKQGRPRSKNRHPDVAVYVPRARRSQPSPEPKVATSDVQVPIQDTTSSDLDARHKSRKPKARMEVYVPKARRQQQEPAENVRVDQKEAINACGEKSETKTDKEHKDVTKDKKHKNKERTRETAGSGEPDGKNHHKKHKHKSKRPRKDVDKHLVQNETHAAAVDMEEPNASISPAELGQEEHIFDASGTWDEEMHFYDSPSTEPEGNKETSSGKFAGVEHVWESVQEIFSENSVMVDPENSQQLGAREQTTGESPGLCDPITDVVSVSSSAPPTLFENAGDTDHSTCSVPAPEYETPDGSEETQGKLSKRKKSLGEDEMSQPTEIISDFIPEEPMCPKSSPCEISTADSNFGAAEVQTSESERETASVSAHVTPVTHKDETIHDRISTKTVEVDNSKPTETGVPQAEDAAIEKSSVDEAEDDADTWDTLFTDEGDALDPTLMEELTSAVGKVQIQKTQFDYYNYQPKDPDLDDPSFEHLIEIYDFPTELITRDLLVAFKEYKERGFDIKWVDDNHAIGIFPSAIAARAVMGMKHPLMKVRPISQASRQTKQKAKKCAMFLEPYRERPETTAAVARSLVAGALGIKSPATREQRDEERRKLREAKEKRRRERQQQKDAWDGSFGKCAMDM